MFLSPPPKSEAVARVYKSSLDSQGFVMNLTHAWAWRPDIFDAFAALRSQLTDHSSLSKRELAVIVCATAAGLGDSYCALAWGRKLAEAADSRSAAAVLRGGSTSELTPRDEALAGWARKVATNPNGTTPEDIANLRDAGFSDQEIADATFFIAFRLAFSTVNDALGAKPDWQLVEGAPPEVVAAVTFGRPAATRDA
jgi:uncharacterized peroxidase-related enzyme